MKQRLFFLVMVTVVFSLFIFSCASSPDETPLSAEHQSLINTKWLSVSSAAETLEFIDRTWCIITDNKGEQIRLNYSVKGQEIIMGNNLFVYQRKEDTLFLIGYPAFNKV